MTGTKLDPAAPMVLFPSPSSAAVAAAAMAGVPSSSNAVPATDQMPPLPVRAATVSKRSALASSNADMPAAAMSVTKRTTFNLPEKGSSAAAAIASSSSSCSNSGSGSSSNASIKSLDPTLPPPSAVFVGIQNVPAPAPQVANALLPPLHPSASNRSGGGSMSSRGPASQSNRSNPSGSISSRSRVIVEPNHPPNHQPSASVGVRGGSDYAPSYLPMAPRPPPTWDDIPAEQALRHSFDFSSGRWVQQAIVVKIDREFFARGSLRYAYYMQELSGNSVDVRSLRDRGNSAHSGIGVGTFAILDHTPEPSVSKTAAPLPGSTSSTPHSHLSGHSSYLGVFFFFFLLFICCCLFLLRHFPPLLFDSFISQP